MTFVPAGLIDGYRKLFSSAMLVLVSSVDLLALSISVALLIPANYRLRVTEDEAESSKIYAWFVASLLIPVHGPAFYCAVRPALPDSVDK